MPSEGILQEEDTVVYTCSNPTQDLVGEGTTTCQIDGTWIPSSLGTCTTSRMSHDAK